MAVLVAAASKYGATQEIAEAIGRTLREHGLATEVRRIEDVETSTATRPSSSGVRSTSGMARARAAVRRGARGRARHAPVWLFSSGPIGEPPRPTEEKAVEIDAIITATGAREHRVFAGRLDKTVMSFGERAAVFAFRAAEGDFHDWVEIEACANEIADVLGAVAPRQ
jgi:menaquinone-dependent protoporphyrinogen oxidase